MGLTFDAHRFYPALGVVPYPPLIGGVSWLAVNLVMTVNGGGPSLQGTLLLLGTLIGLTKNLCRFGFIEGTSANCEFAGVLPACRPGPHKHRSKTRCQKTR